MRDYHEGITHALKAGQMVNKIPLKFSQNEENEMLLRVVRDFKPEWLIVDLPYHGIDTSYYKHLKEKGVKILFIDDSRFITPDVDVILNSSVLARRKTKPDKGKNIRCLFGEEYFIFDDTKINSNCLIRTEGVFNVLMTFGGSDPTGLTKKVLESLMYESFSNLFFRIILGPGYNNTNVVKQLINGRKKQFEIIVNPSDLMPYLLGCDLAICTGGRTMYELLYLDKKFFPISSADHETEVIEEFLRQGLVNDGITEWQPGLFISKFKRVLSFKRSERVENSKN